MAHSKERFPASAPRGRAVLSTVALCVVALSVSARPASGQQQQPSAATKPASSAAKTTTSSATMICDSVAAPAAPRKVVVARPHKPRAARIAPRVAAAPTTPAVKRPRVLAHARRRAPTGRAAGHRTASAPVASRAAPPRCRSAEAAVVPPVGAVADLVNALPWTAPAEPAFPVAAAPSLGELVGGGGLRSGAMFAGLLGAGALWLGSSGHGGTPPTLTMIPPGDMPPPGHDVPPVTTVPEPATLALLASGLAAIGVRSRRKRS